MSKQRAQVLGGMKRIAKRFGVYPYLSKARRTFDLGGYRKRLDAETQLYSEFVGPGDLCFDVGANVGRKTEVFLSLEGEVVAFEPQPDCAEEIQLRCEGMGTLQVERCAIGKERGEVDLDLSTRSGLATVVAETSEADGQLLTVPSYPLDHFADKYGIPRFCKIDVEGYELEVLEGMSFNPECMSLEYHTRTEKEIEDAVQIVKLLEERYRSPVFNYSPEKSRKLALREFSSPEIVKRKLKSDHQDTGSFGDLFVREET